MSEEWALQPAIRSYIDEVFALLLTHALRRDAVDSVALRAEAGPPQGYRNDPRDLSHDTLAA